LQEGAEFRTEDELPVDFGVEQRLFSDPVPRQKELLGAFVPDGEGKHAAQVLGAVSAILVVGVDDGFGVAVGVESVTQLFEFFTQLEIVIDLAVEDYPGTPIEVVDGLLTALEVDNCEATHRQTGGTIDVEAVLVRPAVKDRVIHPRE
jgi:hypothetical protein